ncbi:hypothetical protein ACJMK2_025805 [Sinanodonta woodiana]|uniref:HAT C-terminal dimerisation domain-containing protein n=1 Tax=Sinanodonta woodiana TaxID=1069815 RepID=A0ABD3XHM7_SINWO
MKNREWQFDFAFAVDIIAKLNEFNLKLQGKGVFAHELYAEVKSFQVKLMLFSRELKEHNYAHFPTLQLQTIATESAEKYSQQLSHLNEEFVRRFADFKLLEKDFPLLTVPFTIDIDSVPAELQLELIDLQNGIVLKEQFKGLEMMQFWSSLWKDKFLNLQTFARKMFTLFASTYICEQTFSTMNLNKSKCRSQLTDANLTSIMRIVTSTISPGFEKRVKTCSQLHSSH